MYNEVWVIIMFYDVLPLFVCGHTETSSETMSENGQDPVQGQCWAGVVDARPALAQHRVDEQQRPGGNGMTEPLPATCLSVSVRRKQL